MAYSTPAMVRQALVPGSDGTQTTNSGTAADLDDTQLTDEIAEADAMIDSYIARYYAVPVAVKIAGDDEDGTDGSIPHPIDYWSRNIAAYNATLTFRKNLDFQETDPVARRYNATMTALTAVSRGQATLQLPDNRTPNSGSGAGTPVNPYVGNLFDARDWNLRPLTPDWPLWPDIPSGGGGTW